MHYRSSTHNTGVASHLNRDYYTGGHTREAGREEQLMHGEMLQSWRQDGQPKTGWGWDVQRGQSVGWNAGCYGSYHRY